MTTAYIFFVLLGMAAFITIVFCYAPSGNHDESGRRLLPGRMRSRPWHHDEKYQNEQRRNEEGR
jgi:hypothetical protein